MEPRSDSRAEIALAATTKELRQLGTGMTLGRYTLIRKVAAGGMAEVYAARSEGISGFEKKVAIKKILPQFSLNKRFIDMLVDEAKITVSLTHPNIAQIYELGLEDDTYYIVMEYVDGRPLNRLMQRLDMDGGRTVPVEHAAHIMSEIAKGLHHAHIQKDARGKPLEIVHRDISPQNVLLAYTGDVKLIDFGIARAEGRAARTSAGVIKGKLRYLAPEIAMGEEPDPRADVYCCGIVLFEMLTGEAMFAPRTDVEAIEMATAARVRSPRISNPSVPPDLEDIVMKALRRDRAKRYQNAKELYTELRRFSNQYFPAYVGSELGDLMQDVFGNDIEEDRRLDALAEDVIQGVHSETPDVTLGVKADELAGPPPEVPESNSSYRPVVTRAGEEEDEGLLARHQGTDSDVTQEPTRRAVNPLPPEDDDEELIDDPADREMTVAAPPPTRPPRMQMDDDGTESADPPRGSDPEIVDVGAQTAALPADDPAENTAALPLPSTARRPGAPPVVTKTIPMFPAPKRAIPPKYIVAGVAVIALGLWAGFTMVTPTESPEGEAPSKTALRAPAPPAEDARLVVRVTPEVAVDLIIDGKVERRQEKGPFVIEPITPDVRHTIEVRAENFAPFIRQRTVTAGHEIELLAELKAPMATIEIEGATEVRASIGRVEGNTVVDIPVGSQVELTVPRSGGSPWKKTVSVDKAERLTLQVPRAKKPNRARGSGRVFINSRPMSDIYVNGRRRGRTPKTLTLPSGSQTIRLRHSDGRTHNMRVRVLSGKRSTAVYRWPRR